MVVKTMDEQQFCQGCDQEHNCQQVYKRLGDMEAPCIASGALVAFVLPIVVFAASLAVLDKVLAKVISTTELQIALGCLLALLVTSGLMLAIKLIK
jgi:hypothetical protein